LNAGAAKDGAAKPNVKTAAASVIFVNIFSLLVLAVSGDPMGRFNKSMHTKVGVGCCRNAQRNCQISFIAVTRFINIRVARQSETQSFIQPPFMQPVASTGA
jgi:hypothetical protein